MEISVVVGNPKPASRTLDAATLLARKLDETVFPTVLDVVELGAGLIGWGDDTVTAAIEAVCAADLAIFASPTYKATFTGLLKVFLDLMPSNALAGIVAVPLMLGGGPAHALAPEVSLKPVLVELGATCPTKGLYLLDSTYAESDAIDRWCDVARPQLFASLAVGR